MWSGPVPHEPVEFQCDTAERLWLPLERLIVVKFSHSHDASGPIVPKVTVTSSIVMFNAREYVPPEPWYWNTCTR